MCARATRDEGFTLAELLVVIALLGLVMSGAYGLFHLARVGTEMSDATAWISREIGQPLEHMERMFSQQAPPLVSASQYTCEFKTDQDKDDHYEYHRFEAKADGTLVETVREDVDNPTPRLATWSDHNTNVATTTRLFTYYDINGTDISGEAQLYILQYTASVVIEIVTEHDGKVYTDSRQVFFRNR